MRTAAVVALALLPGLAAAAPIRVPTADLPGIVGTVEDGRFGRRAAAGNLNDDAAGLPDLVVAQADPPALFVFFDPFPDDALHPASILSPAARDLQIELDPDSGLTAEIAIGNVYGGPDSAPDLVVSSPQEDGLLGAVRIYAGPLPADGILAPEDADFVLHGELVNGRLGDELTIGDLDGDGREDLAIGASRTDLVDPEPVGNTGRIHLFAGRSAADWASVTSPEDADVLLQGEGGDYAGFYLEAVSLDGGDVAHLFVSQGYNLADASIAVLEDPFACATSADVTPTTFPEPCLLSVVPPRAAAIHAVPPGQPNGGVWLGDWGGVFLTWTGTGSVDFYPSETDWSDDLVVEAGGSAVLLGDANEDVGFGWSIDSGDLDRDGNDEVVIASPAWDDATDVFSEDAVGAAAGAIVVIDGCHPTGATSPEDPCAAPAAGPHDVSELATHRVTGRQRYEGSFVSVLDPGIEDQERVLVVAGRVLVLAPRHDAPVADDAGAVFVWQPYVDADGDGVRAEDDCDDADPGRSPDLAEDPCNGIDDDCSGAVDATETDDDGDGFAECDDPPDCDDADPLRAPFLVEVACNGVDDDCDGVLHPLETDDDGDGFTECGGDCLDVPVPDEDDGAGGPSPDPEDVFPADGPEASCDGVDDDCDGVPDDGFDADGDGVPGDLGCTSPAGVDCDDGDPSVRPGLPDGPDPADVDCDGSSDWPGGCACDASGPPPAGAVPALLAALLLLAVGLRRRPRHLRLLGALGLAACLLGQVVVPLDDLPILAVGEQNDHLADPWWPGELLTLEGDLYAGIPWRGAGDGVVVRLEGAEADDLPAVLTASWELCVPALPDRHLGYRIATGDFDDDGQADLALGAPGSGASDPSAVWFQSDVVGTASGGACDERADGFTSQQSLGSDLAVGDFDGDGIDDVVAANASGANLFGALRFYPGGPDFFADDASATITSSWGNNAIGLFAGAVDLDCDDDLDLVTSGSGYPLAFLVNDGGGWEGGAIGGVDHFLSGGSAAGYYGNGALQLADDHPTLGDGCPDVLLTLPSHDEHRGAIALVEGGDFASGLDLPGGASAQLHGAGTDDQAGFAVLPVWWTADPATHRYPDLLVAAPQAESAAGAPAGVVYFVRSGVWDASPSSDLEDIAEVRVEGGFHEDFLGAAMALWTDFDGDERPDAVISGAGYDQPDRPASGGLFVLNSAGFADEDADGALAMRDCDDADATVSPEAAEVCDGLDNDCDGDVPSDEVDADSDGVRGCDGDCEDLDPTTLPGADELCDGRDNDCDGALDASEADADADGIRACDGDCDDDDPAAGPGAVEVCDGTDDDCDGATDEGFDLDGDGVTSCADDCDDTDPTVQACGDDDPDPFPGGCTCNASPSPSPTWLAILGGWLAVCRRRR